MIDGLYRMLQQHGFCNLYPVLILNFFFTEPENDTRAAAGSNEFTIL
jgi:hypothetical protein